MGKDVKHTLLHFLEKFSYVQKCVERGFKRFFKKFFEN